MSLPARVVRRFTRVPAAASKADFLLPYNILLYTLFPPNSNFVVAPRWGPSSSHESTFMYEIQYDSDPARVVLVLQPNAPGSLQRRSTREASDRQIRTRMTKLSVGCPMAVLHGISAMGTRLRFYTMPRGEAILTQQIPVNPGMMTDTAPPEGWDCDILEREGEKRFRSVVNEIKHWESSVLAEARKGSRERKKRMN